jgi:hypothetical protein
MVDVNFSKISDGLSNLVHCIEFFVSAFTWESLTEHSTDAVEITSNDLEELFRRLLDYK